MDVKKKMTLEDQLNAVRVKVNKLRPVAPARIIDPSARVLDAVDRKEDLVAVKPFQSEEGSYQAGEKVDTSSWGLAAVAKMARHGYILPQSEYSQALVFQAAEDLYDNTLQPVLSILDQARSDVMKAQNRVAAAAAELATAQRQLGDQTSQVEYWEDHLAGLLKGDNVQALLKE